MQSEKFVNHINREDVKNAGIIFVTSNDPVSRITMTITKQEFSSIGFYYDTTITGKHNTRVVLLDIFGVNSPEWLKTGDTLENLSNNPLISRIAIKELNPVMKGDCIDIQSTKELQANFRSSIANILSTENSKSLKDHISQLFGYHTGCLTKGKTAVEMVNQVIEMIGKWEDVPQSYKKSLIDTDILKPPTIGETDAHAKIQLVGYLGSGFNQQIIKNPTVADKQIQSYIVDNRLFGDLKNVILPKREKIDEEIAMKRALFIYRPYLTKAISTFIDMVLTDQEFFELVISGIDNAGNKVNINEIQDIIEKSNYIETKTIKKMNKWIHSGRIDYDKLKKIFCKLNKNRKSLGNFLHEIDDVQIELPEIRKEVIVGKDDINKAVRELHKEISDVIKEVTTESTIKININNIIEHINCLNTNLNCNLPRISKLDDNSSYGGIFTTNDSSVPIKLKKGKKILLPLSNPNLEQFDRETLLEMLEVLDSVSADDPKYTNIRTSITKELAHR